jgi:HEAT repeat protein
MDTLLEDLSSPLADVRQSALERASASVDTVVAGRLAEMVRSTEFSEQERQSAAAGLGAMPVVAAREMLLGLSRETDAGLRGLGAAGLGAWKSREAMDALLGLLADDVNNVRNLAERSLLGMPDIVRAHGIERLLELLRHPAPLTRSPAARLIGLTGDPRALAPLLGLLQNDRQWLARLWAAKGLGDLGQAEAAGPLAHVLQHDERNRVRAAAAEAIGKLRPANAEELLRRAFETDEDGGVRKMASEALQALGLSGFGEDEDDSFSDA